MKRYRLMSPHEAAEFAGCSKSKLRRYQCGLCEQTAIRQLTHGCGAIWERCDPKEKSWPPKMQPLVAKAPVTDRSFAPTREVVP
jgi:hypothetical protein